MSSTKTIAKPSLGVAIGMTAIAFLLLIPALGIGVLASINVALMFALAWYGWANTPDTPSALASPPAPAVETLPPARRLVPESDPFGSVDRDILRASRLAEDDAAVTALHRFRRTLDGLLKREFHDDVARDLDIIVERNFPELISHYVSARSQASGSQGIEADRILADSLRRLTARLGDIADSQREIDTSRLREHGDYLRNRHPVDTDPFSIIRGDRA